MRFIITLAVVVVLAAIAAFYLGLIDINQTRQGKAPEIAVSGGQAPAFDVHTAKIDIGTKNTSMTVPNVNVGTKTKDVEVPTVHVQK